MEEEWASWKPQLGKTPVNEKVFSSGSGEEEFDSLWSSIISALTWENFGYFIFTLYFTVCIVTLIDNFLRGYKGGQGQSHGVKFTPIYNQNVHIPKGASVAFEFPQKTNASVLFRQPEGATALFDVIDRGNNHIISYTQTFKPIPKFSRSVTDPIPQTWSESKKPCSGTRPRPPDNHPGGGGGDNCFRDRGHDHYDTYNNDEYNNYYVSQMDKFRYGSDASTYSTSPTNYPQQQQRYYQQNRSPIYRPGFQPASANITQKSPRTNLLFDRNYNMNNTNNNNGNRNETKTGTGSQQRWSWSPQTPSTTPSPPFQRHSSSPRTTSSFNFGQNYGSNSNARNITYSLPKAPTPIKPTPPPGLPKTPTPKLPRPTNSGGNQNQSGNTEGPAVRKLSLCYGVNYSYY